MERIYYKKGFKYQLTRTYQTQTSLVGYSVETRYIKLSINGLLTIYQGYCWDGPSGPTIDTKNFMRGSLIHDALYQLMREENLPQEERYLADRILMRACLQDGMCKFRAWYVFESVQKFATTAASPRNKKEELSAP